jgi:tRNA modification GTPase
MHALDETIAAIASPPGGAARGIVRLTGPGLRNCLERGFRPQPYVALAAIVRPTAVKGNFWLPGFASPLPCELYLWPGPRSYTGQPVAEIHTLGSPPLVEAVLRAVCAGGARPAEAGEFTFRAFLAGRIDLTEAEAVLGIIDAAGPQDLDVALSQLAGGLAHPLHGLRDALLELLAHLEAGLDFADEDLPFLTAEQLAAQLQQAANEVHRLRRQMQLRGATVDQVRVTLLGRPNAGKSSLFNRLAPQAGALVSHVPGTTRDYLVAELDLDGVKCQLIDTAGMETDREKGDSPLLCHDQRCASVPASGPFRQMGTVPFFRGTVPGPETSCVPVSVAQAAEAVSREQWRQAHVRLVCIDASRPPDAWEEDLLARPGTADQIVVATKFDLAGGKGSAPIPFPPAVVATSSRTGAGLDALGTALREAVLGLSSPRSGVVPGTAVRCGQSLAMAGESLDRARRIAVAGEGEELVAAEIRVALEELGKVAGAVYTEDVLERIFSRFCVGK